MDVGVEKHSIIYTLTRAVTKAAGREAKKVSDSKMKHPAKRPEQEEK